MDDGKEKNKVKKRANERQMSRRRQVSDVAAKQS